jgi:ribosomal protein L37AE/L43A
MDCKICGKGQVAYTGEGYWFKCDYCGVTEAYVSYDRELKGKLKTKSGLEINHS